MAAKSDELKRADTELRIAQLKFKHALNRDERPQEAIPSVNIVSSTTFCDNLDAVFQQNTTEHVQKCKAWIVAHIAPSEDRVTVLGEYLVSVSKTIVVEKPPKSAKAARNRLDILLVVSDVLHADKFHRDEDTPAANIATTLKLHIEDLVELAALAAPGKDSAAQKKLKGLVNFWASSGYVSSEDINALRERVDEGLAVAQGATPKRKRTYALPDWSGDRSAPWHQQPASSMLEPLLTNPSRSVPTHAIRATRFNQKQPSERVRKLLETYFENIDLHYRPTGDNPTGETNKFKLWLDSLGQLVKQNKESGEVATICNGYGWSAKFCQEMQKNGVPDRVTELRDEYNQKAVQPSRKSRWNSPPRAHDRSSLSPGRRYSHTSNSGSGSRAHSRSSSYERRDQDDRPSSSSSGAYRHQIRGRPYSRDNGKSYKSQFTRNDGRVNDRKRPYDRQSRWNDDLTQRPNFKNPTYAPSASYEPLAGSDPTTGFTSRSSQASGYVPPPPPGRFPGHPTRDFPPPPPPPQHFHGSGQPPPPPPPPDSQGPQYGNGNAAPPPPPPPSSYGSRYGSSEGPPPQHQGSYGSRYSSGDAPAPPHEGFYGSRYGSSGMYGAAAHHGPQYQSAPGQSYNAYGRGNGRGGYQGHQGRGRSGNRGGGNRGGYQGQGRGRGKGY